MDLASPMELSQCHSVFARHDANTQWHEIVSLVAMDDKIDALAEMPRRSAIKDCGQVASAGFAAPAMKALLQPKRLEGKGWPGIKSMDDSACDHENIIGTFYFLSNQVMP